MGYIENFAKAIVDNSKSGDYSVAIKEWVYRGEQFEKKGECCCGHPILDNRIVRNMITGRTLVVGNCCISKFGIERKHFNGSKMAYLELGMEMADSPGITDYLKYETLPRIKAGKKFTLKDIEILEKVTGKVSRFQYEIDTWMQKRGLQKAKTMAEENARRAASLFDF